MYMSNRRILRKRSNDDEGAVLIEFALVIGLFFMLVFGMVDFGLAINTKTQLSNAGREGARLGTVNLVPGVVEARVREAADNLDQTILIVTVTCEKPDDTPCTGPGFPAGDLQNAQSGDSVVVTVDYKYSMITPLPGFIDTDNKIDLQSVTEMRVE
jgi:Flp pilus assembly protein TadG